MQAKAGRHTLYWGESLFLGGHLHSISYAQNPLDLQKGFATPGTEAKELFRPLNQLSPPGAGDRHAVGRRRSTCSSGRRRAIRRRHLPRPGRLRVQRPRPPVHQPGARLRQRGAPSEPKQSGEFGLSARWSPEWLDGTVGFYYRNFADKLPQTLLTTGGPGASATT